MRCVFRVLSFRLYFSIYQQTLCYYSHVFWVCWAVKGCQVSSLPSILPLTSFFLLLGWISFSSLFTWQSKWCICTGLHRWYWCKVIKVNWCVIIKNLYNSCSSYSATPPQKKHCNVSSYFPSSLLFCFLLLLFLCLRANNWRGRRRNCPASPASIKSN